jgi:hypothetical protein
MPIANSQMPKTNNEVEMNKLNKKMKKTDAIVRAWEKVDRLPWNPQLLRELKGRFKPINLIVSGIISIFGQILIYLYFQSKLGNIFQYRTPEELKELSLFDRYCLGTPPGNFVNNTYIGNHTADNYCVTDLLNNWVINWELWYLDLFILLGVIATLGLLVVGSYLVVADLAKEESTGSLNFIRLSTQSANSIFLGKIFGVPCLLYLILLLAMPLHLFAGMSAGIPISFILGFYTILIAACFCCYSLAILFGLANVGMINFKAFLVSGSVLGILILMTNIWFYGFFGSTSQISRTGFDWWSLVYPNTFLTYLVEATHLPQKIVNYLPVTNLEKLNFYGFAIGSNVETYFAVALANYALCIYWIWQGIDRKFRDNTTTFINKKQSYLLTLSVCFVFQGLTLQKIDTEMMTNEYLLFQFIIACFCLGLMLIISPQRQSLYDWARYRHLNNRADRSLWKDLIWGEKSPAIVAFGINLLIILIYTTPAIFLFVKQQEQVPTLWGLILGLNLTLFYASIVQLMFLLNNKRRGILAFVTIVSLMILPLVILGIFGVSTSEMTLAWLFTFLPSMALASSSGMSGIFGTVFIAILGQCLAIGLCNSQIARQLNRASLTASN